MRRFHERRRRAPAPAPAPETTRDVRQVATDMVRKALDERTPREERITTAFTALAFIDKHKLLDAANGNPFAKLVDPESVRKTQETIEAVGETARKVRGLWDELVRPPRR